ncbi:hypothetical protein [Streptomyces sp. TS71-3]|uniref:hypothetical protein n=1 Tax=Streptomyces sp. TS71-3 TaxID=2733862 RepID=UPI001B00AB42|nr:hypothetical protein [Streptomyces sp. TS71-3]GHJ41695.1 hypothetical protein Sm713_73040 [Streptomyces sp. TS71-3]
MAVGSAGAGRRGAARLIAVCAVLFGLFFMHGAPATAMEGCHGAVPVIAAPPAAGGHHAAAMVDTGAAMTGVDAGAPGASAPAVRHAGTSGMAGAPCLSTPAQERAPLPAPGQLAVAVAGGLALWTPARPAAAAGDAGRRRRPAGGRDLLRQVCIART